MFIIGGKWAAETYSINIIGNISTYPILKFGLCLAGIDMDYYLSVILHQVIRAGRCRWGRAKCIIGTIKNIIMRKYFTTCLPSFILWFAESLDILDSLIVEEQAVATPCDRAHAE